MAHPRSSSGASSLIRTIQSNTLLNRQLSAICQLNGLRQTGVKSQLQNRILNYIQAVACDENPTKYDELEQSIRQVTSGNSSGSNNNTPSYLATSSSPSSMSTTSRTPGHMSTPSQRTSYTNGSANGYTGYSQNTAWSKSHSSSTALKFKPSPFYAPIKQIGKVRKCEVMSQYRHSFGNIVRVQDEPELQKCLQDPTMRVMVFCAADCNGIQDIAFPHQSEIKVNGGDVKANLRGLKNKPGSTRPVDITSHLRLKIGTYSNNVEFVYALTTKEFYVVLYLCKITPVEKLVEGINAGKKIPQASVIREITSKAQDPDIETTSQVLPLKCPLTYMRLQTPCRSLNCGHVQCFDAESYLLLQEQGPQWLCPICNKSAPFGQLAVDEYVKDILNRTSSSTDQVTIEPDGAWQLQGVEEEERRQPKRESSEPNYSLLDDDDDDDALLALSAIDGTSGTGFLTPVRPHSNGLGASSMSSLHEPSPVGRASTSSKRPIAEVIDLTLSDDEDDDDAEPPSKRQNTASSGFAF